MLGSLFTWQAAYWVVCASILLLKYLENESLTGIIQANSYFPEYIFFRLLFCLSDIDFVAGRRCVFVNMVAVHLIGRLLCVEATIT